MILRLVLLLLTLPAAVQAQFNYVTNDGTITITGYTGSGGAVTIPGTIDGLPVTRIGDYAFHNRTSLTSITIPSSVTSIGEGAFFGCTSLTGVTIPNSVTSVGDEAFGSCTSLTTIMVDALNAIYSSVDGVLFNKSQTTLIGCPGGKAGSYTIPDSVTSIGYRAFAYCTGLTDVVIPNSVTSIGGSAFRSCHSLTSVTIGNSVTSIADNAFDSCTSLTSVTIGSSVTSIESEAFIGCHSLTNITIPDSVTHISTFVFSGCRNLTSITIGSAVTNIGNGAFIDCTNLAAVFFRGDAPSLGYDVFRYATSATIYFLPGTRGWWTPFGGRPTAAWRLPYPLILKLPPAFGVRSNAFGFIISWATNTSVAVEACTNLAHPLWVSVATNTLVGGSSYFNDPEWTNYPARFYRLRSP